MYPHYHHQPLDTANNIVPGTLYHPPHPVVQQYHHSMQPHPTVHTQGPPPPTASAPAPAGAGARHCQPTATAALSEPLPSASDVQQTLGLTLPQMAEFASSMVYLMWHARRPSVMALHDASKSAVTPSAADHDAIQSRETANIANATSNAFKKFSRQILHATQLSESVVMLSLKYIAMLLQKNPNIQGAEGSEYRLFTVALMLANKFLDDNTFTNKTWSEVSGMKVTDLNIMELEFLDVLTFRLFVGKDEFERWKMALVNLKNQLHSVYQAQEQQQRQKMIEASLKSVGVPMLQPQEPWGVSHDVVRQQQQQPTPSQQQQQQQQHAAVQQQYHQQYLYLLSKAQQPQVPPQPINQPIVRVPLRIPAQPVYMNAAHSTSHIPQQQQQQSAPVQASSQQPAAVYDVPVIVASSTNMVPQQYSAESNKRLYPSQPQQPPQQPQPPPPQVQPPPPADTQFTSQYSTRHTPVAVATSRPMYDAYGRPTEIADYSAAYGGIGGASSQGYSAVTAAAYAQQPQGQPQPQPPPQSMNNSALRTTSLQQPASTPTSQACQSDYINSSGGVLQSNPSRYYYNTPTATPTSTHTDNGYIYGNGAAGGVGSGSRPARSYYHESPAPAVLQQQIATPATAPMDYHTYSLASSQQPVIGGDGYPNNSTQRPSILRTSSNPPYQYPQQQPPVSGGYNKTYPPRNPPPQQPNHHQPQSQASSATLTNEDYSNGPVPEDPLTAAASYRTTRR
ncbi:hypothetical protein BX666DRAFT_1888783 [Dichotomocladium elegans]|nr:hypothetical protein BX666DRAFT_1888783 [Dichotomocladium elegans]